MRKNNKSAEEIREIVARLEAVVNELKEIGCFGSIKMNETTFDGEERPIQLLIRNEDMPEGKARYEKSGLKCYHDIIKIVKIDNVEFLDYLSKKEAEEELFA